MTTSSPSVAADFALIPGAVAWARRGSGGEATSNVTSPTDTRTTASTDTSSGLWWPVILYPTWSHAAKESGLMGLTDDKNGATTTSNGNQSIRISGCKKPISLNHLRRNMVPKAAALRPPVHGSRRPGKQNRVVAHFLGLCPYTLDSSVDAWGAVDVNGILQYRQNAYDIIKGCQGKVGRSDWVDLLRAVDEASTALEDWTISSKELLRNIPEVQQPQKQQKQQQQQQQAEKKAAAKIAQGGTDVDSSKYAKKEEKQADNDDDDDACYGQTPEFYVDWKGSESQSQRNTQFSQVNFIQAQFTLGNSQAAAVDETTCATKDQKKSDSKAVDASVVESSGNEKEQLDTSSTKNVAPSVPASTAKEQNAAAVSEEVFLPNKEQRAETAAAAVAVASEEVVPSNKASSTVVATKEKDDASDAELSDDETQDVNDNNAKALSGDGVLSDKVQETLTVDGEAKSADTAVEESVSKDAKTQKASETSIENNEDNSAVALEEEISLSKEKEASKPTKESGLKDGEAQKVSEASNTSNEDDAAKTSNAAKEATLKATDTSNNRIENLAASEVKAPKEKENVLGDESESSDDEGTQDISNIETQPVSNKGANLYESQDISDIETQPISNKEADVSRSPIPTFGVAVVPTAGTTTNTTHTPFPSSKATAKKVSPSPIVETTSNIPETMNIASDTESILDGLDSKRLFNEGNGGADLTSNGSKRSIDMDTESVPAGKGETKKARTEESFFCAEEEEKGKEMSQEESEEVKALSFFTQAFDSE